jgi:hypothetical protein
MSELDRVFSGKVKQTGIFDFKELYRYCYTWIVDEGYLLTEKTYSEKITPTGKELEIIWEARKKISDYFRFNIKINWRILGMTSVEVEEGGKKLKMDKGQVEIKVEAVLEKDYEHRWENNSFSKFLRGVYDKYIIRGRIDQYEGKIFMETDEFLAQVKSFLAISGMHT